MFPRFKNKALNPWQPRIFSRSSDMWASGTWVLPPSTTWSLEYGHVRKTRASSLCCYVFVYLPHRHRKHTRHPAGKPPQSEQSCLTAEAFRIPQKGQFICTRPYFHPQSPFISSDLTVTRHTQLVCDEDDPVSDVTDVVAREKRRGQLVITEKIKTSGRFALRR